MIPFNFKNVSERFSFQIYFCVVIHYYKGNIANLSSPSARHVPVISWQNRPAPIATVEAPEAGVKINIKRGVPLQKDGSA